MTEWILNQRILIGPSLRYVFILRKVLLLDIHNGRVVSKYLKIINSSGSIIFVGDYMV